MTESEAQAARLIVDNSVFEAFPGRDPFTPRIPAEEVRVAPAEPVVPVRIPEPVVVPPAPPVLPPPPPPAPVIAPVVSVPKPVEPLPALTISGLVWNTDRPQAIINGRITGIGDMIAGVTIIDIQKDGITVQFRDRTEKIEIGR